MKPPALPFPFTLRRARLADIPALFVVRTAVRENHMSLVDLAQAGITPGSVNALMRSRNAAAWIGFEQGRPAGFSLARGTTGDVFALFVLPQAEGRGLATQLLAEAERWLAARGVEEAWLLTGGEPGLRAPGFYAARGWQDIGREPDGQIRFAKRLETWG